tara:strand:- start:4210 stop:5157 length:948 start_codon:yes stop_codon:yes gene_type:complete
MALQFLPWLIRAGQGLASATGAKGVARGAAKYLDPRKVPLEKGKRYDVVNNVVQARTRRGAIPNYLSQPGFGPTAIKAGLTLGGGSIAADRIASMMRDDPSYEMEDIKAIRGSILPSNEMPTKLDFESRQAFEARKSKRMNKQMKRLLQYYGIVNLVNPDAASDMLKLGTAMLEQEIGQMGTDRQAKIFDAIFKDGSMPKSGAEAARMILNAGGTAEDVADITDIYESITPKAPDLAEDERGVLDLQQARSLVAAGYDNEAVNLIEDSIRAGRLENEQEAGMPMSPRKQAQMMVQAMGGAASGGLDSSLLNIEPE